jgi:uncharacterized protein
LSEISEKLLSQFVNCLEHDVLTRPEETLTAVADASAAIQADAASATVAAPSTAAPSTEPAAEATKPTVRKIEYKAAEPVDLLDAAGSPILKRVAPVAAVVLVLLWLLRRRK